MFVSMADLTLATQSAVVPAIFWALCTVFILACVTASLIAFFRERRAPK